MFTVFCIALLSSFLSNAIYPYSHHMIIITLEYTQVADEPLQNLKLCAKFIQLYSFYTPAHNGNC